MAKLLVSIILLLLLFQNCYILKTTGHERAKFLASIRLKKFAHKSSQNFGHIATGVLVSPTLIACTGLGSDIITGEFNKHNFIVSLGTNKAEKIYNIKEYYNYTLGFSKYDLDWDLGAIVIDGRIENGHPKIGRIIVSENFPLEGMVCTTIGWIGRRNLKKFSESSVTIRSNAICGRETDKSDSLRISCTDKEICKYDVGSPLICNGYLMGLRSVDICQTTDDSSFDSPAIYVNVAPHITSILFAALVREAISANLLALSSIISINFLIQKLPFLLIFANL